jgi:hypothetical protein
MLCKSRSRGLLTFVDAIDAQSRSSRQEPEETGDDDVVVVAAALRPPAVATDDDSAGEVKSVRNGGGGGGGECCARVGVLLPSAAATPTALPSTVGGNVFCHPKTTIHFVRADDDSAGEVKSVRNGGGGGGGECCARVGVGAANHAPRSRTASKACSLSSTRSTHSRVLLVRSRRKQATQRRRVCCRRRSSDADDPPSLLDNLAHGLGDDFPTPIAYRLESLLTFVDAIDAQSRSSRQEPEETGDDEPPISAR